jgi:hypothetical protein
MKANELRIGNWYKGDCLAQQYWQITAQEILDFYDDPIDDYFQPIEITKEWLLKLGFEYNNNYDNYVIRARDYYNSVGWNDEDCEWYYNNDRSDAGCYYITDIKYVHQLQNLYFALTQEELQYESK